MTLPYPNIDWLQGGERPSGTVTPGNSDGNLNRPLAQLQANILDLQDQVDVLAGGTSPHNSLASLQGGNATERFHLSDDEHNRTVGGIDNNNLHTHDGRYYTQGQVDALVAGASGGIKPVSALTNNRSMEIVADLPNAGNGWREIVHADYGIPSNAILYARILSISATQASGTFSVVWTYLRSNSQGAGDANPTLSGPTGYEELLTYSNTTDASAGAGIIRSAHAWDGFLIPENGDGTTSVFFIPYNALQCYLKILGYVEV